MAVGCPGGGAGPSSSYQVRKLAILDNQHTARLGSVLSDATGAGKSFRTTRVPRKRLEILDRDSGGGEVSAQDAQVYSMPQYTRYARPDPQED